MQNMDHISVLRNLALKNQELISLNLDLGLLDEVKGLLEIDRRLSFLAMHYKMLGNSTHYIWRTQDDKKVRPSHAANDDKVFAWDSPPATGHPGEDFGCRCWAEPVGDDEYANQILISPVNDNPKKWSDKDFLLHFILGNGEEVALAAIGYLQEIIDFYEDQAIAKDGMPGVYRRVNQQIIDEAKKIGTGRFQYAFDNEYNFEDVLYTFRHSTVSGLFEGEVRSEKEFMVINGIVTYDFFDEFADPISLVEAQVRVFGTDRDEAERRVRGLANIFGNVYPVTGHWQTKFNASVKK